MTNERPDGFTRDPWEQQPGESDRHFIAFDCYRKQGLAYPRSVFKAVAELFKQDGKEPPSRSAISSDWRKAAERWQWVKRAGAWDKAERRRLDYEQDEARRNFRAEEIALLSETITFLRAAVQAIQAADLKPADALRELRMFTERRSVAIDDTPEARERRRLDAAQSGFTMVTPADKGLA